MYKFYSKRHFERVAKRFLFNTALPTFGMLAMTYGVMVATLLRNT